jgi:hypothetical protein
MPARSEGVMSNRSLGPAILSLLVAADQRCPAIIGAAHLIYYTRFNARRDETARAFAQLKRDAEDLMAAVAAVEAAMAGRAIASERSEDR